MTEENIEQVSGSALKRFFGYVWGMIIAPIFTMDRLTEEPKKNRITVFSLIFSNMIVVLIIGTIIFYRSVTPLTGEFSSVHEIIWFSINTLISFNVVVSVITFFHLLLLKLTDIPCTQHVVYSYMLSVILSVFSLVGITTVCFIGPVSSEYYLTYGFFGFPLIIPFFPLLMINMYLFLSLGDYFNFIPALCIITLFTIWYLVALIVSRRKKLKVRIYSCNTLYPIFFSILL